MATRRASIAQVMFVIALVAANLALVRAVPAAISTFPTMWLFLGLVDFVVFWKLIGRASPSSVSLHVSQRAYPSLPRHGNPGRYRANPPAG